MAEHPLLLPLSASTAVIHRVPPFPSRTAASHGSGSSSSIGRWQHAPMRTALFLAPTMNGSSSPSCGRVRSSPCARTDPAWPPPWQTASSSAAALGQSPAAAAQHSRQQQQQPAQQQLQAALQTSSTPDLLSLHTRPPLAVARHNSSEDSPPDLPRQLQQPLLSCSAQQQQSGCPPTAATATRQPTPAQQQHNNIRWSPTSDLQQLPPLSWRAIAVVGDRPGSPSFVSVSFSLSIHLTVCV